MITDVLSSHWLLFYSRLSVSFLSKGIKEIEVSSLGFKLRWHRDITRQENLFLVESFSAIYICSCGLYSLTVCSSFFVNSRSVTVLLFWSYVIILAYKIK